MDKYDKGESCKTAGKFFGKDTINFVGIDGTEYSRPLFDMIIFYAGVLVGSNVTWINNDGSFPSHTIISGDPGKGPSNIFYSPQISIGAKFTFELDLLR